MYLVNNRPVEPAKWCRIPPADPRRGIKPAGLLSLKGTMYMAVEAMNYGDNPTFNRQHNIHGWIVTSTDYGQNWHLTATPVDFFTGRLCSCHFLNFGRDYAGARDPYVYAYFQCADDGNSYWCNNDQILLGRVPQERILERGAWQFACGRPGDGEPGWSADEREAVPVFRYPLMTGENHVTYNAGLRRYLMGNFSFTDEAGKPRPYHQHWPQTVAPSQLTLFEAPEPWGPWSMFHLDDHWGGHCGDYQPIFPTKWMSEDGRTLWMVSAGSFDDYNLTYQRLTLQA